MFSNLFGGLALKLIIGLALSGGAIGYVMVTRSQKAALVAQIAERDRTIESAVIKINNSRDRVIEMARIMADQATMQRKRYDALREADAVAAQQKIDDALTSREIVRTIVKWREKDETLNMCLAYKLPGDFVRQLEH